MVERVWNSPEIFRIYVPLPDNPLKNLNVYVLRTSRASLIIDTGFNRPECREALWAGLEELKLDLSSASLFLTHLHSDHTGLVWNFVEQGVPVYMGRREVEYCARVGAEGILEQMSAAFRAEGLPAENPAARKEENQASLYAPASGYPTIEVENGQEFWVGKCRIRAICTPGHTPGHMVLYLPEEKLLFSGDHILFDITPNITCWPGVTDPLSSYIDSLKNIRKLEIKETFPAHRSTGEKTSIKG